MHGGAGSPLQPSVAGAACVQRHARAEGSPTRVPALPGISPAARPAACSPWPPCHSTSCGGDPTLPTQPSWPASLQPPPGRVSRHGGPGPDPWRTLAGVPPHTPTPPPGFLTSTTPPYTCSSTAAPPPPPLPALRLLPGLCPLCMMATRLSKRGEQGVCTSLQQASGPLTRATNFLTPMQARPSTLTCLLPATWPPWASRPGDGPAAPRRPPPSQRSAATPRSSTDRRSGMVLGSVTWAQPLMGSNAGPAEQAMLAAAPAERNKRARLPPAHLLPPFCKTHRFMNVTIAVL